MQSATYDNYPWWIVATCNLVTLAIYAAGLFLMAHLGIVAAVLYAAYCLWMEWRVLSGSCRYCSYFGKACAFGKGRLCACFFTRVQQRPDRNKPISWRHLVPDFLVSLIPLFVGIILLILGFSWDLLLAAVALLLLASVVTGAIRGHLACNHCRQRDLGCPAAELFNKTKPA